MDDNSNLSLGSRSASERLFGPAVIFTHPEEVLRSRALSHVEKRALLAGWASDAHAVPGLPAMRQLDSGAIVSIDAVLAALRTLDVGEDEHNRTKRAPPPRPLANLIPQWRHFRKKSGRDDDDDPPPCPAAILPPGMDLALRHHCEAEQALMAA